MACVKVGEGEEEEDGEEDGGGGVQEGVHGAAVEGFGGEIG